jgi:hypothetical protein
MTETLEPNQIFVFGSNKMGNHYSGAAQQAYDKFGALWGAGWGLYGQSYAFPTLGYKMEQLPLSNLETERDNLYDCCNRNKHLTFLLTKVGCGIAGYPEEDIKPLFTNAPDNLIKPKGW